MKGRTEEYRLWDRVREKKSDAFGKFYLTYAADLIAYGLQLSNNEQLTEDAVHDLFLTIFRKGKRLAGDVEPRAYLFRALRNNILKVMVAERRMRGDINGADRYLFTESAVTDRLDDDHLRLLKMLNKLSPQEKEVIYLRFFEEMKNSQIGEVLGLKKQTVKNVVCSAMKKLRCLITYPEEKK